ncbi:IclR family transcriptional regulator [Natrialba chahannaoensis]|nr:IclR family transcriptional regulator [Natrialba chahannaoensis]
MAKSDNTAAPRTLKTVTRSVDIINLLMELDRARLTEIADHVNMSKSTTYTYLKSLEKSGLISRTQNQYRLSANMLVYGGYVRNNNILYEIGKPEIDALATETGQYSHLVIEEHGRGINLYKAKGEEAVGDDYQIAKFQQRDYLHITASGKAILAYLPEERVREILNTHGLPSRTEETITDRDELFNELDDIRERGFAYNDEEEIEGFRAVGAPIRDRNGTILGSLSVSAPISIFKDERFYDEIPELVVNVANIIEVNINMSHRSSEITE